MKKPRDRPSLLKPKSLLEKTKDYLRERAPYLSRSRRKRIKVSKKNISSALQEVKRKYPFVKGGYLFGSVRKGDPNPGDIDLMLIIDESALKKFQKRHPSIVKEHRGLLRDSILRAPHFAQKRLYESLKIKTGLSLGTTLEQGRRATEYGFLHFDPNNPEVGRFYLLLKRIDMLGSPKMFAEKEKQPFLLMRWNFVETSPAIVKQLMTEWKKIIRTPYEQISSEFDQKYDKIMHWWKDEKTN